MWEGVRKVSSVLLTLAATLIVIWSIIHVGNRVLRGDPENRSVTLKMLVWGNAAEMAVYRDAIVEFESANPDIRINLIHVPHANFEAKLKTMIAAGDPPDAFFLPYPMLPEYASLGLVEPMEPSLAEYGGAWADDIYPVLIRGFRYDADTQTRGEGTLWGVPGDFTPLAMYINVDLFEQAGVPIPRDGWTWDEYEHATRKIDNLGPDYFGSFLESWPDALLAIIWNHDGNLFHVDEHGRPDYERPAIDDPGLRATFERLRRLRLDEGIVHNAVGLNRSGSQEFFAGRVGSIGPTGRWVSNLCEEADEFRYDVVPIPHVPGSVERSPIMTIAWTVSADSKHKPEAKRLAMYMVSPELQLERAKTGLSVPSVRSIAQTPALRDPTRQTDDMPMYLRLAEYADVQQWPREGEFQDILLSEHDAALRLGTRSIDDALVNIEQRWLRELASPLKSQSYARLPWVPVLGTLTAGVLLVGGVIAWRARRDRLGPLDRAHERAGFALISPWVIGFVTLAAGPMLLSGALALSRWSATTPLGEAEYVGLGNFRHMLLHDPPFWKSLIVTGYYVVLAIPIGQIAALAVALLMNT
ncbi:MAG: extracellular solute-binding protein [Planctomycetota bacterium]